MRSCRLLAVLAIVLLASAALAGDIHDAVLQGNTESVAEIIDADSAAIHAPNSQGMTPLRLAAHTGNVEMMRLLLERGAAPDDTHPIYGSIVNQAFVGACQSAGGSDAVLFLIDHGAPFDAAQVDGLGMTTLDWAVQFNNIQLAKLAIQSGADINFVSERMGRPPLTTAAVKGYSELAAMLLEYKADVSIPDDHGKPAVFYTVEQGRTSILRQLLACMAPVDFIESYYGRSLLHIAAIKGYRDVAELLVNRGARLDAKDNSGNTPLHYASKYGNRDVADFLIQCGANKPTTLPDESNRTMSSTTDVKTGEARIRYLNHRGWLVRTESHILVLDAEEFGVRRSDNPSLQNGFLVAEELAPQKVVALYSCYHGEPGEPAYIHTLADSLEDIAFVHLLDDAWRGSPNTVYVQGGADTTVADIRVQTINIADHMPELAYLCHVDGLVIYYQAYGMDNPDSLIQRFSFLSRFADTIDIAFLPIPESEQENPDIQSFLHKFPTRAIVLLDSNRQEHLFPGVARRIADWGFSSRVFCAQNPGDRFDY